MSFEPSEKLQAILDMINEFVDKELIPMEAESKGKEFYGMTDELEKKRQMVRDMELWAPVHPKEHGGMGLPLMETAMIYEALGRTPFGLYVFGCSAPDAGNAEILHKYGTPEQKEKYLQPLIDGKIRS
ncbi:MAG: acyl-CoA dehydrogenase, partial [Deltaproteobacteria bacterium]|nr:acyl-CoA dehydrogenase [Deltaproteobacteria bacterium]